MRSQNFFGFVLGVAEVISLLHVSVDSWRVDWVICWFSAEISGSWGSAVLRLSRCSVRLWISGVRFATKFLRNPVGIEALDAVLTICWNNSESADAFVVG